MPTPGSVKRYLSGAWSREGSIILNVPNPAALPTAPDEDDVFAFVGSTKRLLRSVSGTWVEAGVLDGLSDVTAPTPALGQALVWDGSQWKPNAVPPVYSTLAALNTGWPSAPDGSIAFVTGDVLHVRMAGVWRAMGGQSWRQTLTQSFPTGETTINGSSTGQLRPDARRWYFNLDMYADASQAATAGTLYFRVNGANYSVLNVQCNGAYNTIPTPWSFDGVITSTSFATNTIRVGGGFLNIMDRGPI